MNEEQTEMVEAFLTGVLIVCVFGIMITSMMGERDYAVVLAILGFIDGVILWTL